MNKKELRWRVIYGYGPTEYIAIGEVDLEKAKYAMITGKVFAGPRMLQGNEIKRIEEDFRFYTGWYDSYVPKEGEDHVQMLRDMPDKKLFTERVQLADTRVGYILKANQPSLLFDVARVDQLLLA